MEYVLIYAALGFTTFGYRWHKVKVDPKNELAPFERLVSCGSAGLFFWLYWPGLAAIYLMQPRKKETTK